MRKNYIVWFDEVGKEDIPLVGGKGANLGEMTHAGFPIPFGFIVTSSGYFHFIEGAALREPIDRVLKELNHKDTASLKRVSEKIQNMILTAPFPDDIAQLVTSYYERLYAREKRHAGHAAKLLQSMRGVYAPSLVAIRSSATAEDLPGASFAGQQETYLNVQGTANVIESIRKCWASLFTQRAIFYRSEQGFDHFKVGLAAVVQRMVQSDQSGILFTVDPVTSDKETLVIEAVFGLGEFIVQGKVTPDQFLIDKKTLTIREKRVHTQDVMMVKRGTKNYEKRLTHAQGSKQKIPDALVRDLAAIGKAIEKHYFFPQDIEWAVEKEKVFIVQSRPITTLKEKMSLTQSITMAVEKEKFLEGDPASPGIATGVVVRLTSPKEIGKIKKGDILVASQTNPDYVPAMKKAAAILTEHGGRTSHAAIVSRELGIPCVVGIPELMAKLKEGAIITVNGSDGSVYKGKVAIRTQDAVLHHAYKTKTKVYLNVGEPDKVKGVSALPCDGVGLLRAEFMIATIGEHPKAMLKKGHGDTFTTELARGIKTVAEAFYPRNVIYRATDFKTNEYRFLKGGKLFEPEEENPLIGYRGAYRYISEPDVFALEIAALKRVREKGLTNVHLMLPFVRAPEHIKEIRNMVEDAGLVFGKDFKLWMMVELPVNVISLDTFLDMGVDGVSIGSNDLTMLTLGIDRDNEALSSLYDERNSAVEWAIKRTIEICSRRGVTSSICGQSVSDFPEMLAFVVKAGITSVSVSPDAFWRVKQEVHSIETHGNIR